MKCLESVELMELLYAEADPETLLRWRNHLTECEKCRTAYWQLNDTRDWFRRNKPEPEPVVILMSPPPKNSFFHRVRITAAAAVLVFFIGMGSLYLNQLHRETKTLLVRQSQVEQKLRNTNLQVQDTNRNQYMMLLALKDYLDKNYQTRKVSYDRFR